MTSIMPLALAACVVVLCLSVVPQAECYHLYVDIDEPQHFGPPVSATAEFLIGLVVSADPEEWPGVTETHVGVYLIDADDKRTLLFKKPHKHAHAGQHTLISYRVQLAQLGLEAGSYVLQSTLFADDGSMWENSGESRELVILKNSKRFVYMVQSYTEKDFSDRIHEDADVVQLIWGDPPKFENPPWHQVYAPGTTANAGRNRVLEESKKLGDYLYYIQCDDDARMDWTDHHKHVKARGGGNPWRAFESYLIEWEPAVGFVRNEDRETRTEEEVQLQLHFDTILTAYHREAINFLMPLETRWDGVSWWYASCPLWLTSRKFWNNHRIQFNGLKVWNDAHTDYPKVNNWTVPISYMMPALKMPEIQLFDFNQRHYPLEWLGDGVPMKKNGSYVPADDSYDPCHPFFLEKRAGSIFLPGGSRVVCDFEYTDDYLHYRREQEHILWAKEMNAKQAARIVELERQVATLSGTVETLMQAVGVGATRKNAVEDAANDKIEL